jgi:hypothetical protein
VEIRPALCGFLVYRPIQEMGNCRGGGGVQPVIAGGSLRHCLPCYQSPTPKAKGWLLSEDSPLARSTDLDRNRMRLTADFRG